MFQTVVEWSSCRRSYWNSDKLKIYFFVNGQLSQRLFRIAQASSGFALDLIRGFAVPPPRTHTIKPLATFSTYSGFFWENWNLSLSSLVIRPVSRNKLSFSSIKINKPLPAPVYSLPQIWCLITLGVECNIINIDSNITDNIISMPQRMESLGYIRCHSSSSSKPINSPSNSIRYNCQKVCSWSRRPETMLLIRKEAAVFEVINRSFYKFSKTLLTTERRLMGQ